MEHRWGTRVGVLVPVRIVSGEERSTRGYMVDLSLSGACIRTRARLPKMSLVQLELDAFPSMRSARIEGYVVRAAHHVLGIEWGEFAPPLIRDLIANRNAPQVCAGSFAAEDETGAAAAALGVRTSGLHARAAPLG